MRLSFTALLSGVLAGLSQPLVIAPLAGTPIDPTGFSGLLAFVAYVPLLLALREESARRAFLAGWLASTVQIVIIAHWVVFAFAVAGVPILIGVLPMILCGAALGAITGLGFWAAVKIHRKFGWPIGLIFPATLTAADLTRNYLPFGGDPWGTIGMSMASIDLLRQGASLVGVYGLVFFVALINGAIAEALGAAEKRAHWVTLAGGVLLSWAVFGWIQLSTRYEPHPRTVTVGLLQASIPQVLINDPNARADAMIAPYHALQSRALAEGAELVVWPETALLPAVPADVIMLPGIVSSTTAPQPPAAIVGGAAIRSEGNNTYVYNSAFAVTGKLDVTGRFDKLHLVPFGEYVPWPFGALLRRMVNVQFELLPGDAEKVVPLRVGQKEIRAGVTICWDGVFPEVSRRFANNGAEVMFNLTNDGWYGVSSEPYQHLAMYQMRATETARSVARAANSGISAFVDRHGRILQHTALNESTVLIGQLIPSDGTTVYSSGGHLFPWVVLVFVLAALAATLGRFRRA